MTVDEMIQAFGEKPCQEAIDWIGDRTLVEAWRDCCRPDWLIWAAERLGATAAQLRLCVCRLVHETPLADGRTVWDLLTDPRSRAAVEVAERYARGEATDAELVAARDAAGAAACAVAWAAWDAAWAARAAARAAADAAAAAAADAAAAAAADAARAAARTTAAAAAGDASGAQSRIIREHFASLFERSRNDRHHPHPHGQRNQSARALAIPPATGK